ncbi:MAG: TIGR03086 family protein [Propionibacteriales bacterium]|nr:TIGR03086 family protein [Propionibacteriales bacterium]
MTWEGQRDDYLDSLAWVASLMHATERAQRELPTPCAEFTVRLLMGHLVGTAHRGLGTAQGTSTRHISHVVTDVADDDLATTYSSLTQQIEAAWASRQGDDEVTAPWGVCSAHAAAHGFTVETVTHGWDLAVATGQPAHLEAVAQRCLDTAGPQIVPERLRGVMYDSPRTTQEDSATARLAHLLGHRRR